MSQPQPLPSVLQDMRWDIAGARGKVLPTDPRLLEVLGGFMEEVSLGLDLERCQQAGMRGGIREGSSEHASLTHSRSEARLGMLSWCGGHVLGPRVAG